MQPSIDTVTLSFWGNTLLPSTTVEITKPQRNKPKERIVHATMRRNDSFNIQEHSEYLCALLEAIKVAADENNACIRRIVFISPTPRTYLNFSDCVAQAINIDTNIELLVRKTKSLFQEKATPHDMNFMQNLHLEIVSSFLLARTLACCTRENRFCFKEKMLVVFPTYYQHAVSKDNVHFTPIARDHFFEIIAVVIPKYGTLPDKTHPYQKHALESLLGGFFDEDILPDYTQMAIAREQEKKIQRLAKTGIDLNQQIPDEEIDNTLKDLARGMVENFSSEELRKMFLLKSEFGKGPCNQMLSLQIWVKRFHEDFKSQFLALESEADRLNAKYCKKSEEDSMS